MAHAQSVHGLSDSLLAATTISASDKERWLVEWSFKWTKPNLRIHAFLGTSRNAVLTRIGVSLSPRLLLA